jgi:hypothetical protein
MKSSAAQTATGAMQVGDDGNTVIPFLRLPSHAVYPGHAVGARHSQPVSQVTSFDGLD